MTRREGVRSAGAALALAALVAGCSAPGAGGGPTPTAPGAGDGRGAEREAEAPERRVSRPALGTLVEVAVRDPDRERARQAIEAAFAEVARLEGLLSKWREDSEISALNRAAPGEWVALSLETLRALRAARRVAEETGGAFDPTVLPLLRLWGFAGGEPRVPAAAEIDSTLAHVGWEALEIDAEPPRARLRRPGMAVGLGGIGKGFIADAALGVVRGHGAAAAMVSAAGDLAFYGGRPERPWRIAVEDPDRPGEPLAGLDLLRGGVSTSAPTYRAFEAGGRRHHHLIDPRTGRPARGVRSATVVAPDATRSDAYSTAIFVMGARGPAFLAAHPELQAILLFDDGSRFRSPSLEVRWLDR